ncbi:hypothetical protein ACVW1C_007400 [Bradyrhizobium sp. USDA 4011]
MKRYARLFDKSNGQFHSPIEGDVDKRNGQYRRDGSRSIGQSCDGEAYWTAIVQCPMLAIAGSPLIGRHDRCNQRSGLMPPDRMHMTKGQRKVEAERDQPKTGNKPNVVPKKTHLEQNRPNHWSTARNKLI